MMYRYFIKVTGRAAVVAGALALATACQSARKAQPLIPVTPAWALGHIVWEDEFNTRDSLFGLIRQYQSQDIPVDGVIIDSPWTTSYNDFIWDTARYPDPQEMTARLQEMGVHALLWLTGVENTVSNDCPEDKSAFFDEAVSKGYTVNDGEVFEPGTVINRTYALDEFPLFVREGSILPAALEGRRALLVSPGTGKMNALFHLPLSDDTSFTDCRVRFDPRKGTIRIDSDTVGPWWIVLRDVAPVAAVSGCTEYRYDADARTLLIGAEGKRVKIRFE